MVEASIVIETNEALNTFNDAKLHLREIPEVAIYACFLFLWVFLCKGVEYLSPI